MANPKHLEIIKQGVKVWNKWRFENKIGEVNLINADLTNLNLSNVNFNYAQLEGANLSYSNLNNSTLTWANLTRTKLNKAKLNSADFSRANLHQVDLSFADLSDSTLSRVDLSAANICNANFNKAYISSTNLSSSNLSNSTFKEAVILWTNIVRSNLENTDFSDCEMMYNSFGLTNLESTKGLETVKIKGECSIDFQTLRNSKNIPKEFLLKIGLPENYINYLPDFYDDSPLRLFPVFLSHSWANKDFAGKLYEALIKRGVLVWYDEKKLRAGDKIFEGLTKAINVYDKMILVCSKESLEESWWVDEEMNRIFKKERTYLKEKKKNVSLLIPITIDQHIFKWDGAKGESIRDKVIGDFSEWKDDAKFEKALNELIEALNVDRGEENIKTYL